MESGAARNRSGVKEMACSEGRSVNRGGVCPEAVVRLAGESPVGVMTKQPRSWWPAEGEIRPSKRHDEAVMDGKRVIGPYVEESDCRVEMLNLARARTGGSRALTSRAKAMDGAKSLEAQHSRTRRHRGSGTITRSTPEQERSVSAPALWSREANPRRPVGGDTYKPIAKW